MNFLLMLHEKIDHPIGNFLLMLHEKMVMTKLRKITCLNDLHKQCSKADATLLIVNSSSFMGEAC